MNNKFLGMLGLAKRAGKVQTGEDICSKAVKSGVSKLIIVACIKLPSWWWQRTHLIIQKNQ